jgi:cardiolipin synthase
VCGAGPAVSERWLTVPNALTLSRLLLVPVFVALHLTGHPVWALVCFLGAALTDSLDGFLARVLNQWSKLGAFLDPVADKVLTGTALVLLVVEKRAPLWMLLLVAFRDGAMALGAVVVRRKGLDLPTAPSRIGKYATFALACFVVLGLLDQAVRDWAMLHAWFQVTGYLTGLCVFISTTQYFVRWGHLWVAPARRAES